ncbi:hypothetical protein [Psychroserpens sp.]|uniref:hypothetical protein n=1 Tax=Psychroserpens sp. TaxID=2020870 RepID=UPI00385D33DE
MRHTILILSVLVFGFAYTQESSEIVDAYEDYADLSREQIYLHLNKSTYITGEMMGFSAYVFLKDIKELSTNTSNLYCQILDENDIVKSEKFLMVNQGLSRGDFMIDSTFSSGEYKLKAYTNWSRNFSHEHNYFLETFSVINPDDKLDDKSESISKDLDIQVLPESGHLLSETLNVVGVIVKNQLGLGISNLDLNILNTNGDILSSVKLNQFGMGKFLLNPSKGDVYKIEYLYDDKTLTYTIPKAEDLGVILSLKETKAQNGIALALKTNDKGLELFGNRNYKLVIHNGSNASEATMSFNGSKESVTTIDSKYLYPGVNIFTLFDDQDRPIAERLYFHYNGLPFDLKSEINTTVTINDSIDVKLSIPSVDIQKLQNLSVSVLPTETKSYEHHQNIISAIYLQPYLKSAVEQASYYFTDISDKKKYELDNLLLTQGWSAYDWTKIFNSPPEPIYDFEVGVNYIINVNNSKSKNLLIYPNVNSKSELLTLDENQKSFEKRGFFPLDDEKLRIGEINSNSGLRPSNVVLQFSPSKIETFDTKYKPQSVLTANQYAINDVGDFKFGDIEVLDEVKLLVKKEYTRIEKLKNRSLGTITDFGEAERRNYRTFGQFISARGFNVDETPQVDPITNEYSTFRIFAYVRSSVNASNEPIIYLDDTFLVDLNILNNFSLKTVDYIEVNKGGIGEGLKGGAGVIRIYTDPNKRFEFEPQKVFTEYKIPLTFEAPKRFYIPKYKSTESKFFREYGTIDWLPNANVDANGDISLKVLNTNSNMTLFIEGVVNDNVLVSKQIKINY